MPCFIAKNNRIITTICKHIISNNITIRTYYRIRIDKSTRLWVIISAIEIIQPCLSIVIVPPIPEWIERANAIDICYSSMITPSVILIFRLFIAILIINSSDIALQILFIIISYIIIFKSTDTAHIIKV